MARKQWRKSQPETQVKSADAEEWAYMNPILGAGEPGYVLDTQEFKIGDGKTRFDSLPSISGGSSSDAGSFIQVVPHGDDANYPRPEGVTVVYWLGTVEPVNAVEEDLLSLEVDVP